MEEQEDRRTAIDTFREERGAAIILALLVFLVVLGIGAIALNARSPVTLSRAAPATAAVEALSARELGRLDPAVDRAPAADPGGRTPGRR